MLLKVIACVYEGKIQAVRCATSPMSQPLRHPFSLLPLSSFFQHFHAFTWNSDRSHYIVFTVSSLYHCAEHVSARMLMTGPVFVRSRKRKVVYLECIDSGFPCNLPYPFPIEHVVLSSFQVLFCCFTAFEIKHFLIRSLLINSSDVS